MKAPRKEKKRKTGRPLEDVPMRTLVKRVKADLRSRIRAATPDKPKKG
jgi:hypothetical protein